MTISRIGPCSDESCSFFFFKAIAMKPCTCAVSFVSFVQKPTGNLSFYSISGFRSELGLRGMAAGYSFSNTLTHALAIGKL